MKKAFTDVFRDCSRFGTKLPTSEYQQAGRNPIIDQGQAAIAGYTDLEDGVFHDIPAIIFGDHTRIVKYVDQPFFMGADGVKILKAIDSNADYRYLYYALRFVNIPNTGYNRHYRLLKESFVTIEELPRQREIVRVLDKVEAVIDKHERQLAKLDELAKARFVEMLNNNKPKNIPISSVGNVFTGSTPPTADPGNYEHRDIPFVKPSDLDMDYPVILDRIENYVAEKARGIVRMYPPNSVLVACIASVGKMGIATKPGTCNQQINVVVPDEGFHPVYIAHAIFSRQRYIIEAANKAVVPILNKRNFSQLTIPIIPLPLQRQFAEFVTHIERMKGKVRVSLEATQKLLGSLMQEYFS